MPVAMGDACGGTATKANGWENVGIAASAGMKCPPSILLDLQCFLWFLLLSCLILFVRVALFKDVMGLAYMGIFG